MVYGAPRELIGASGAALTEIPRHADRGVCCGAGGARMWMEEHIGKRVNHERCRRGAGHRRHQDRHRPPVLPVTRYARSRSLADVAPEHGVPALVPAN